MVPDTRYDKAQIMIIKKILLTLMLGVTFTMASDLYTDTYMYRSGVVYPEIPTGITNHVNGNTLMQKRRVFSKPIYFKDQKFTEESRKALDEIQGIIRSGRSGSYYVSIIGHTSYFTDEYHFIEMNEWSRFWQNLGGKRMSRKELADTVNQRIFAVYKWFKEGNVNQKKIYTENRMHRDPIATEETREGRMINNRVDVTLYY
jgi:outer membrane protein OmpA-like peptidoglycan-associated protein